MKIVLVILMTLMYGCASIDEPYMDLPYGDTDWEFRMMMHEFGF